MPTPRRLRALLPAVVLIASVVAPLALAQPPGFPRPSFPKPPEIPRPSFPKPPQFQKVWTCSKCGHTWPDSGGPRPSNCPKCGVSFINGGPKLPDAKPPETPPQQPNAGGMPNPGGMPNANVPNANVPNGGGLPAMGAGDMQQQWTCSNCKNAWTTTGAGTPEKCPKCGKFFDKIVNPDGSTTQTRHGRIGMYVGIGTAVVVLAAVGIKAAVSASSGSRRPKKRKRKKVRRPRDDDDDY